MPVECEPVESLLASVLREQRISGQFCSVRLLVGKRTTWAHAALLCPLSTYVNTYYNSHKHNKIGHSTKFETSMKIKLTGKVSHDCFECLETLLDLIYGRKTTVDKNHSSHVISYCNLLNLSETFSGLIHSAVDSDESFVEDNQIIKSEPLEELCEESFEHNEDDHTLDDMDIDYGDVDNEQLPNHVKLPTGKTQNCIGCRFKCYKTIDLLNHLRRTSHGGNVCSLCWTELDNADELQRHFVLHEHPKPFFCTYCDLRFQTRSLLGQHLPGHMFEKPYTCPHCSKAFKRKHGLNCHLVTHTGERKHLCDECGFSTLHAKILRAHKLAHSGDLFKCSFPDCAHTSTRKENMKQHMKTHSNEKPFVCELCGHKFTQSKSLKRHSLIHSKSGHDHFCPHCPFKARRIDNLKAHILRQHTDKVPKVQVKHYTEDIMIEPDVRNIIEPTNEINRRKT
ncbi:uncharacterized protein LOC143918568 [Arctopsyche grandis]|uniref:uncharacterized protein LOC143918568 n=1 Tax=Arctopsyche grandis TaxID=121162 RepID=UPI00406D91B4